MEITKLMRADLSPAERAAHQAERKKLYEREFLRHATVATANQVAKMAT